MADKVKKIKVNKYQPIFRIPKEWIDPQGEKRTKIPIVIEMSDERISITKERIK